MKICLIYNYAQHYRTNIFTLLDRELDIDFYFGDDMGDVKKMDYSLLHHKVKELKNRTLWRIEWQSDCVSLAFRKYDAYVMLGTPMCLSTWLCAFFASILGKKVIFWTHGWYGKESTFERILKKLFYKIPDHIMLYGNYAKELLLKEGLDEEKLSVIHNSLMYDAQLEIRKNLKASNVFVDHFKNGFQTVVFVGRLTPVKKLHQLLEAQKDCQEKDFNFNVVFIGDGTQKTELENLSSSLKLNDKVWFYGSSYNEDELSILLYNADLCVAPGNIGLTAMHAMVYGCPCVSHNDFKWQMPEFEAINSGITGDFFERDNVQSLANTIRAWLVNSKSRREEVRQSCFDEIDTSWNPYYQLEVINRALSN